MAQSEIERLRTAVRVAQHALIEAGQALEALAEEGRAVPAGMVVTATPLVAIGLDRIAGRALEDAGVATVESLADHSRAEVAALAGLGPEAVALLDAALAVEGLAWAG
jgi:hypothetical protein